jgi:protein required for attachment to host cells
MKPVRTWILIADGGRGRIVENAGPGRGVHLANGMEFHTELPANREIFADRPGRSVEAVGYARHSKEEPPDPHRELKRKFATMLCSVLDRKLAERAFDRLILVAPAATMGDLRAGLSNQVRARVSAEVVADLTKVPINKLDQHLDAVIAL